MSIQPGETFVEGRSPETARALLDACDRVGVPQETVRTSIAGYYVPDAVADALADPDPTDPDSTF